MPTHSEHIVPHPLRLPFLLHLGGILCGTFTDHVVGEQQRTARPTCDCCGRGLHRDPSRWYTYHLAPWNIVSSPQLHRGDDHLYRHVCLHGGHHNCQLDIPAARKSVESREEGEDEEG